MGVDVLQVLLFHLPEEAGIRHIPYFSQGIQVASEKLVDTAEPNTPFDSMERENLAVANVMLDEQQHEIVIDGLPIGDLVDLEPGKKYRARLLMRPGIGRYRSLVLMDGKALELSDDEFAVYWESNEDLTYAIDFDLWAPTKAGYYEFFALTIEQDEVKSGGVKHDTSPLYLIRVLDL